MDNQKYHIAMPPREAFVREPSGEQTIINEGSVSFIAEKVEISKTKGMLLHMRGAEFPKKGFPFPEAMFHINQAKRLFIASLKLYSNNIISFILLNKKQAIDTYCDIAYKTIHPYMLKEEYMMPVARELQSILRKILCTLSLNTQLADIFATMIQYDDAYHYRALDLFSETQAMWLYNEPIRETRRLIKIVTERDDSPDVVKKMKAISLLLTILLTVPKFRRAFKKAMQSSYLTFSNLQYDEADKYWVMNRGDYKFMGLSHEERSARMNNKPLGVKLC